MPINPAELDEATDEVVLYRSEDVRRLRELSDELNKAMVDKVLGKQEQRSEYDDDPAVEAGRAYDEFHAQALERATRVQIKALGHQAYFDIVAEHPPRRDVLDEDGKVAQTFPQDRQYGFNVATFGPVLVPASVVVEGQFDDEAARDTWLGKLSAPRWNRLFGACVRLNEDGGPDPKVSASSMLEQMSSAISRSQPASD